MTFIFTLGRKCRITDLMSEMINHILKGRLWLLGNSWAVRNKKGSSWGRFKGFVYFR